VAGFFCSMPPAILVDLGFEAPGIRGASSIGAP
jgi:hypothetical protein